MPRPDEAVRQAGLRLDSAEVAHGVLPSGRRALVPGDLDQSQLFQRIAAVDALDRMPPAHADSTLSDREIEVLGRFILQGAEFEDHWAYRPPERPDPPAVAEAGWPRGDLDRFVLARLEQEGLAPSPEADRRTLVRRLSLDLTGLPPTPAEVDAFLADDRPDAYERLIDRLLASDRYGEHMARTWLDAARYADTNGYHIDNERTMWRWGCAKCHDHKFDPVSQREYYQLAAFFNTVDEVGLDGSQGNAEPRIPAPDLGQRAAPGYGSSCARSRATSRRRCAGSG